MVSSALNTLRGMPQKQADIYNEYLPKSAQIRADIYIAGPAKLAQLERLVTTAQNALQSLLDAANKAETTIRNKAASLIPGGAASDVGEGVRDTIRNGYANGLNLTTLLDIMVQQNDRPALAALKSLIPYYEKDTDRAMKLVAAHELKLYTRDELATLAETYELDASMAALRTNFHGYSGTITQVDGLFPFFAAQLLPGAVAGMFKRLSSLSPWYGLSPERLSQIRSQGVEWESLPHDKLLLVSDFDQVELANVRATGGPAR